MKKKFFLTFMAILTSVMSWGYSVNQTFYAYDKTTKKEITDILYYAIEVDESKGLTCGVALCNLTGNVTIPATVYTKQAKTFTVTESCQSATTSDIISKYPNPYGDGITSLTFSEGLTTFNFVGFRNCSATTLNLPKSLSSIGNSEYAVFPKLNSVTITEGGSFKVVQSTEENDCILSSDGKNIYYACGYKHGTTTASHEVTFPDGITAIKTYFTALTSNSANYIGTINLNKDFSDYYIYESSSQTSFNLSSRFKKFTVEDGNTTYCAHDGILFKLPKAEVDDEERTWGTTLVCYPRGKTPDLNDDNVKQYTTPRSVTSIADYAFSHCDNIDSLRIRDEVTTIGVAALYDCAFKYITIPKNVTSIGEKALSGCENLKAITVADGNTSYASHDGVLYTAGYTTLISCPAAKAGEYKIHANTEAISDNAFAYCDDLTSLTLTGSKLKTIGVSAFYKCEGLISLTIPKTVTSMAYQSCIYLTNLETLEFEDATNTQLDTLIIGDRWFVGDNKVQTITMPARLYSIAQKSLGTSSHRTGINVPTVQFAKGSILSYLGTLTVAMDPRVETFDLTNCTKLKTIRSECFANLENLKTVKLPKNITTINKSAFYNTPNLKTITFANNSKITTIGANAFDDCGITSIDLPQSVVTVEKEAFANCTSLTTVNIPASATTISPEAFKFCTNLTKFTVDADNTTYSALDGMLCSKDKKTLELFPPGKASKTFTLLSPSFETIGEYAFYYCKNLENIVIPKKISKIGNYAFEFCDNLNSITFLTEAPPSLLEADVATDNANTDANLQDHRFGNADESPAEFLKNHVTINIRTNGHQEEYTTEGDIDRNGDSTADTDGNGNKLTSYWNDCKGYTYSFKAGASNSGRTDITNSYDYLAMSDNTVGVLKSYSTCNTAVVPASVTNNGKTYSVGMIADYAFEDISENVKEIVFLGPIEFVGSNAFNNGHYDANGDGVIDPETEYNENPTSNIERIFFTDYKNTGANELSTERFELGTIYGTNLYTEFTSDQKIYVPSSKLKTYQAAWPSFKDQIAYKIPLDMKATSEYGTFSREFDVDFRNCGNGTRSGVTGANKFLAFTGKTKEFNDNYIGIQMISINCTAGTTSETGITNGGDGTFIPANTGVLIKNYVTTDESKTYNYRIGEKDTDYPNETFPTTSGVQIFKPVVEDKITWTTDADVANKYYISGGKYYTCYSGMTMPAHKSYIDAGAALPEGSSSGAKTIKLIWNDSDVSATAIHNIVTEQSQDVIYDLTGRRVQNTSAKGLYIVNGKKMMIK